MTWASKDYSPEPPLKLVYNWDSPVTKDDSDRYCYAYRDALVFKRPVMKGMWFWKKATKRAIFTIPEELTKKFQIDRDKCEMIIVHKNNEDRKYGNKALYFHRSIFRHRDDHYFRCEDKPEILIEL